MWERRYLHFLLLLLIPDSGRASCVNTAGEPPSPRGEEDKRHSDNDEHEACALHLPLKPLGLSPTSVSTSDGETLCCLLRA